MFSGTEHPESEFSTAHAYNYKTASKNEAEKNDILLVSYQSTFAPKNSKGLKKIKM